MKTDLTDTDRDLLRMVVHRWMNLKEPTIRKALVLRFKAPQRLDELTRESFFRTIDNDKYRPTFLAFQFCGDSNVLSFAKYATAVVLRTLRNLFEVELQKGTFSYAEIESHARKIYDLVEAETIKLGLYLSQEFGLFSGYTSNQAGTEIGSVGISERIVTIEDFDAVWDDEVQMRTAIPEQPETRGFELGDIEDINGRVLPLEAFQPPIRPRGEVKKARLREILVDLSKLRLCGPSDDPDAQTAVTESYKYLLTHVKRLSKGVVSTEVRRELDTL